MVSSGDRYYSGAYHLPVRCRQVEALHTSQQQEPADTLGEIGSRLPPGRRGFSDVLTAGRARSARTGSTTTILTISGSIRSKQEHERPTSTYAHGTGALPRLRAAQDRRIEPHHSVANSRRGVAGKSLSVVPAWRHRTATFHAMRHYYASLLIRHGESVKTVQARLGHKSAAETLDTYSHLWPDSDDRTRGAVDAVLNAGGLADHLRTGTRA